MRAHVAQISVALLIFTSALQPAQAIRDVSHEDIRDAILSLIHMFRDNTDKLERHEFREKQLGEQLKKAFTVVDKKQKQEEDMINTIAQTLANVDKRLQNMEDKMSKDVDNSLSDSKLERLEKLLETKLGKLQQLIENVHTTSELNRMSLNDRLDSTGKHMAQIMSDVDAVKNKVHEAALSADSTEVLPLTLVNSLESKIKTIKPQLQEFEQSITRSLMTQQMSTQEVKMLLQEILDNSKETLRRSDLPLIANATEEGMGKIKTEIMSFEERLSSSLQERIIGNQEVLNREQEITLLGVAEVVNKTEALYLGVQKSYEQLSTDIKGLSKIEQVLIQTADNVLDTKRRIEYGTHQILLEIADMIKDQSREMNYTIHSRFDGISSTILDNQNGGLGNLSTKIETEIGQVWRQIGIMYQTLTSSAVALDRLQRQTETYVNGSLTTMDNMEGKVGLITSRMTEVDENLNYLLGRLSLVTQEFSQIKTGLGEALDNIRSSFHTIQDKMKVEESGPGPNPIAEDNVEIYGDKSDTAKYTIGS